MELEKVAVFTTLTGRTLLKRHLLNEDFKVRGVPFSFPGRAVQREPKSKDSA